MSVVQWCLVAWITVNALIMFGKGCRGYSHTYTLQEGVLGLIESAVAIWLVSTL